MASKDVVVLIRNDGPSITFRIEPSAKGYIEVVALGGRQGARSAGTISQDTDRKFLKQYTHSAQPFLHFRTYEECLADLELRYRSQFQVLVNGYFKGTIYLSERKSLKGQWAHSFHFFGRFRTPEKALEHLLGKSLSEVRVAETS